MSRSNKLVILGIVLVAVAAAGWLALRSGDPTAFAKGKRVELADFHGPDPTGAPASLAGADLVVRVANISRAPQIARLATPYLGASLLRVACPSSYRLSARFIRQTLPPTRKRVLAIGAMMNL